METFTALVETRDDLRGHFDTYNAGVEEGRETAFRARPAWAEIVAAALERSHGFFFEHIFVDYFS